MHIERLAAPGSAHNKEISKRNKTTARFHQQQLEGQTESKNSTIVPCPFLRGTAFKNIKAKTRKGRAGKPPYLEVRKIQEQKRKVKRKTKTKNETGSAKKGIRGTKGVLAKKANTGSGKQGGCGSPRNKGGAAHQSLDFVGYSATDLTRPDFSCCSEDIFICFDLIVSSVHTQTFDFWSNLIHFKRSTSVDLDCSEICYRRLI